MMNFTGKYDLSGYTFIIPSVSVGNVAQLTTDLIISTLSLKKIGCIFDPSIIPIIGPPCFQHEKGLTTSSDVYICEKNKIIILQLRSPLVASLMGGLFDKLTEFIKREKILRLIIISGNFAHEKHSIESSCYEYLNNEHFSIENKIELKNADWVESIQGGNHGSGFAKKLMDCATRKNIPALILLKYVSEGDNIPDAINLTDKINSYLKILPINANGESIVSHPISWKFLYGNSPPLNIY